MSFFGSSKNINANEKELQATSRKDVYFIFWLLVIVLNMGVVLQFFSVSSEFTMKVSINDVNFYVDNFKPAALPLNIILSAMLIYVSIYGGVEAGVSIVQTVKLPKNHEAQLPLYKQKRLFFMIIGVLEIALVYTGLSILTQYELSQHEISSRDFYHLNNAYEVLGASVVVYALATRGSKPFKNINIEKKEETIDREE